MNVKALLRLDTRLGVPLCFAFTIVRALAGGAPPPGAPRSILFIKLAEQGSTVLAYPALRRAVEMVGRQNVYFIALEDNRFIVDLLDVIPVENVITIPQKTLPALVRGAFAALGKLWRLKLDAAVDLEFFSRGSAVLAYLSRAPRRAGPQVRCYHAAKEGASGFPTGLFAAADGDCEACLTRSGSSRSTFSLRKVATVRPSCLRAF